MRAVAVREIWMHQGKLPAEFGARPWQQASRKKKQDCHVDRRTRERQEKKKCRQSGVAINCKSELQVKAEPVHFRSIAIS